MSKSYRPYDPDQQLLMPAALHQWLPEDHLAYFISEGWAWTRSSHRTRPAMAECRLRLPGGRISSDLSPRDGMHRKLQTKRGRHRYALRMQTVEPVFGQIKQGRGFRQFLLRGLEKVSGEWSLICTGHNLLKLFRFGVCQPRETLTNRFVGSIENVAEVVSTVVCTKPVVNQWLHPATIVVAV